LKISTLHAATLSFRSASNTRGQPHQPADRPENHQEAALLSQRGMERPRSIGLLGAGIQSITPATRHHLDGRSGTPAVIQCRCCLLTAMQMPIRDGYSATHAIRTEAPWRNRPEIRGVPIVAMTASAIQGDKEKCVKCGMDVSLARQRPYIVITRH
jgi:CheY-like chemotaxis protein